ncbi:multidrug transporter [Alteromonas sp. KC3]|uniref:TolC family protein n=1 Tax=unclassified Alteromonas TaxID=2614992 RepID=UPI0019204C6F|nr:MULTISPECIES: TolC family protein [unclassified Alteromonas]BCO20525.1 multidrug transporter [Alteromonas sp. KC3]BCO24494.1 multidrug transporter [Alteromonas sp. KC14]
MVVDVVKVKALLKLAVIAIPLATLFTAPSYAQATAKREAPSISAFIDSMVHYHPYVLAINEGNYQAAAELEIARSNFDPVIEQKTNSRVSGYYDGTNLTQRFTNPIEDFNGSVFGEYRISDGDFPSYEGGYETLSAGEASVGVAISLLQNREIDKRRTELRNAGLATSQWQALATSLINDFIYKGIVEYIAWYESALQVSAVKELLATASEREKALVTRVEKGDLASIILTEFKANLLQQKLLLAELKQKRDAHAQMLSFYWRSSTGDMLVINETTPPSDIQWPFWIGNGQLITLRNALRQHPELDIMKLEQAVVENKSALAENALLPKLDLKASVARDIGSGSETLEGTETKLGLSFSYPLGNRKAKAERAQLQSKQRELQHKLVSTQQAITQRFEQALVYWTQAKDIVELQSENATLAKTLSRVERTRFDAGDSDMFVLNARAQNEIKAQIKEIKARVDLLKAELMLYKESAMLYSMK